jgi:hypothetical protein
VDAIKAYYEARELEELCNSFDIELENNGLTHVETRLAKKLISQSEHGSNRRFLESIVPSLLSRCKEGIAKTEWQGRDFHEQMESRLQRLVILMDDQKIPAEITVSENQPFTAKSVAREFLGKAETNITIVDPYIGLGTLDCLRDVRFPIRVLTGDRGDSVELGFDKGLEIFCAEARAIEIRRHAKLHDRYIVFNDRCWLVGSSLKDAGKKTFSVIELVDSKAVILAELDRKWADSKAWVAPEV